MDSDDISIRTTE
jgi:hypothetical protein